MPVTIKTGVMKYKDPTTGNYVGVDAVGNILSDTIAPDYSDLTYPVAVGKLCYHESKLYSAKQAISTAEAWTAAHWDEVTVEEELNKKYTKPSGGIPASDIANGVIPDVSGFYTKPAGGIPSSDLANGVIPDVSGFYTKPTSGIPASDIADGVIPDPEDLIDDEAGEGDTDKVWSADKIADETSRLSGAIDGKADEPTGTKSAGKVYGLDSNLAPVWMAVSGGGVVDNDFSTTSENPVQNKVITAVVNGITEKNISPNLYDKTTCNPLDKTVYNNSHAYASNNSYAVTGKMPVEPNTQYIFSTGGIAKVQYVVQFSGEDGGTFVSETKIQDAAFTTGASTTFVDFEIFARQHTTDEFNAAINAAQLNEGSVPQEYQPYGQITYTVPTASLEDSEAVQGAKNYTVKESLINIYDKTIAVDNTVFNESQGKTTSSSNYAFSGLVSVKPNTQYCFSIQKGLPKGYISSWYQLWNESGVFISETQGNQQTNFLNQIHTTANTAFISFNIYFDEAHTTEEFNSAINTIMVVEGTQRPAEYVPYSLEPVADHLKFDNMYHENADRFRGKKWLVTGTSVSYQDSKYYTEGVAAGEVVNGYIGNIARRKPMLVTNVAVSGSTLAGSDTDALINRYQNLNMGSYDFITIEYGINDFGNDVIVGTASDAPGTGTFAACLKTIIEYALNQNPIVGLIICTDPDVRGATTNGNGNTLKDYADVMIEIAEQYRLPVCDWFYHSGINSITKGNGTSRYFLTQSGTHPSVYGHMRMAGMLNQVFDSLLC